MTDDQIASALAHTLVLERDARSYWQAATMADERDAALSIVRLTTPVIRSLEQWMTARAQRVAQ